MAQTYADRMAALAGRISQLQPKLWRAKPGKNWQRLDAKLPENQTPDKTEVEEDEELQELQEQEPEEVCESEAMVENLESGRKTWVGCPRESQVWRRQSLVETKDQGVTEEQRRRKELVFEQLCQTQVSLMRQFNLRSPDAVTRSVSHNLVPLASVDPPSCWYSLDSERSGGRRLSVNLVQERVGGLPLAEWLGNLRAQSLAEEGGAEAGALSDVFNVLLQALGCLWGFYAVPIKSAAAPFYLDGLNLDRDLHVTTNYQAPLLIYEVAGLVFPLINSNKLLKLTNYTAAASAQSRNQNLRASGTESLEPTMNEGFAPPLRMICAILRAFTKQFPPLQVFLNEKGLAAGCLNSEIKNLAGLRTLIQELITAMEASSKLHAANLDNLHQDSYEDESDDSLLGGLLPQIF